MAKYLIVLNEREGKRMINLDAGDDENATIYQIVDRAIAAGLVLDPLGLAMDITAIHLNGCPLRLNEWLAAPDFSFAHDVTGITANIDRRTGQLRNCFLPRFSN